MEMCFDNSFAELSPDQQAVLLGELKSIAKRYMLKERLGHTFQATALVNEAYVNLANKQITVDNRVHFIAIAARQMRRILVDHARKKLSVKRDHQPVLMTVSDVPNHTDVNTIELIYLDQLMTQLEQFDKRSAQAFELRLFSELENKDIASLLEISLATLERDLKAAKAWLKVELANINGI